jgi:hypothetical protein
MTSAEQTLSIRQMKLLQVVAEGAGKWDARWIDITMTTRHGAGEVTVLRELQGLERLGLVVCDLSGSGVGGRWRVTSEAHVYLD